MATFDVQPFERPKFRQLLAILGLVWLVMVMVLTTDEVWHWLPLKWTDPIADLLVYLLLFGSGSLWVVGQYRQQGVDLRAIAGPWPTPFPWRALLAIWLPLLIFSMGAFQVSYTLLSFLWPQQVERALQESLFLGAGETSLPWLYNLLLLGVLVVAAPVLEEFLFRGFLLHRWGTRWNPVVAVILSSLLFGVLHANVLGLSVFGLVMALLYLRSGSLGLVIAVHSFNNGVAAALDLLTQWLGDTTPLTLETFRRNIWLGILFLLVSTPFLVRFVRQNWWVTKTPLPYFSHRDRPPGAERQK